jgi:hypothetical protein
MEIVGSALSAKSGEIFDFKISGFFQIVIVGDDVRIFLALDSRSGNCETREQGNGGKK